MSGGFYAWQTEVVDGAIVSRRRLRLAEEPPLSPAEDAPDGRWPTQRPLDSLVLPAAEDE